MRAYKCGIKKSDFIREIKHHMELDDFVKGTYGNYNQLAGKGCAVGCSIKSINRLTNNQFDTSSHRVYENMLGIPEWLARLEDQIFENLLLEESKQWPLQFSMAIKVNVDLSVVKNKILYFIVESTLKCFDHNKFSQVYKAAIDILKLLKLKTPNKNKLEAAADAADAAADAAARTAVAGADAAARAAVAGADAAARTAVAVARTAAAAAWAAADAVAARAAADAVDRAAVAAAWAAADAVADADAADAAADAAARAAVAAAAFYKDLSQFIIKTLKAMKV